MSCVRIFRRYYKAGHFKFQLGIKAIFDKNNSGLTKILNSKEQLYVSKAVQKAYIEVNEEGATAAAATGKNTFIK